MVNSENKTTTPIPRFLHSKFGCLLFSIGGSNSGTTLVEGVGAGKLYFPLFKLANNREALIQGQNASTNFVADCS